jgi:predicted dehydrogenase/aryl-alcohol dehydrogenase-like predicted oxidoreductase
MTSKLAWGILGTGSIARTLAAAITRSKTGALVAVGSRSEKSANEFGDKFSVPRRHASYEALLADPEVQIVYISTPHSHHAQWAIRAAQAGKHILCEKPLGINHAQAMATIEAAERAGVFLMEAFMYRCHPQTKKLVELVRDRAIGDLRLIEAAFSFAANVGPEQRLANNDLAGGGILDVGCYTVSMSRLLAGAAHQQPFAEPIEVKGAGVLGPTGVDEYAAATLTFPGGILAQVSCGVRLAHDSGLRLYGTEGRITLASPWMPARDGGTTVISVKRHGAKEPTDIRIDTEEGLFSIEVDTVAAHIADHQAPELSWADTLGNMRALDRWRQSFSFQYDSEKPERATTPVDGRPLEVKRPTKMKYGSIAGVDKHISRLVMGVDNQDTMPHMAVMFDDFIERGGNCFDTAFIYGPNREKLLGQYVKNRGIRKDITVIVKGAHTPWCNPADMSKQLEQSLSNFGFDHADIYVLHRDNPDIPVGEFVDALNEHHRAGRIHAFGGSNWTMARVQAANDYAKAHGLKGFSVVSNNFSLARMVEAPWNGCIAASDSESRAWLTKHDLALLAWSSQARGFFTDRARPDLTSDQELVRCWYSDDNFERKKRVNELAKKRGVLPINIALAYVLAQPFPTFALIGPRILSETRTSWPALDVELEPNEIKWLNLED